MSFPKGNVLLWHLQAAEPALGTNCNHYAKALSHSQHVQHSRGEDWVPNAIELFTHLPSAWKCFAKDANLIMYLLMQTNVLLLQTPLLPPCIFHHELQFTSVWKAQGISNVMKSICEMFIGANSSWFLISGCRYEYICCECKTDAWHPQRATQTQALPL